MYGRILERSISSCHSLHCFQKEVLLHVQDVGVNDN